MPTYTTEFTLKTSGDTDIRDVTDRAAEIVRKSGVSTGLLNLFISGSTASITTIEFEDGLVSDMKEAVERIAPSSLPYEHNKRWGDGNGHSHIRASLMGPSLSIPVRKGGMLLGTWQQIVVVDFDNRPRSRTVEATVVGDA